ncbi:MAG: hypothetical protein ACRCVT_04000 [Leadbetterella sp.]
MVQYIYYLIFLVFNPKYFTQIDQKNNTRVLFNQAYAKNDYTKALKIYTGIKESGRSIEPELRINAAQAYFFIQDTLNSRINYQVLRDNSNPKVASLTDNQLGVLATYNKDTLKALRYLQSSIEKNPEDEESRFNFELLRKLYKKKYNPTPPVNSTQNGQVVSSINKDQELEAYKSEKISKERAIQMLNTLKNQESFYQPSQKNTSKKSEKNW